MIDDQKGDVLADSRSILNRWKTRLLANECTYVELATLGRTERTAFGVRWLLNVRRNGPDNRLIMSALLIRHIPRCND